MNRHRLIKLVLTAVPLFATLPLKAESWENQQAPIVAHDQQEIKSATAVFNGYLMNIYGKLIIRRCDMVVAAHPGGVENVYAGICRIKSGGTIIVCGDTSIGEFALSNCSDRNLIDNSTRMPLLGFAKTNCPGA